MTGLVRRLTNFFGFKIINYDFPRWHNAEWDNWDAIDTLLNAAGLINVSGVWTNNTLYTVGQRLIDSDEGTIWICAVSHTSAASGTFADDRTANPTYWTAFSTLPNYRGTWVTATNYVPGDIVVVSTYKYYYCIASHTSSAAFVDDASKWTLVFDATLAVTTSTNAASAAAASASAAATSETNAAISESNAAASESNADADRIAAQAARVGAETAETNAETAETNAENAQVAAEAARDAAINYVGASTAAVRWDIAQSLTDGNITQARNNLKLDTGHFDPWRNKIINGNFAINQRSISTPTDDVYVQDRHYFLADNLTDFSPTAAIAVEDNRSYGSFQLFNTVPNGTLARFGVAQIIDPDLVGPLTGQLLTLGGYIKSAHPGSTLHYAVVGYASATPVSDIVNNWASTNYTATNFFTTGCTVYGKGSQVLTSGAATFELKTTTPVASNRLSIIVFAWIQSTVNDQTESFKINWGLVPGDASMTIEPEAFNTRPQSLEFLQCAKFYSRGLPSLVLQQYHAAAGSPRLPYAFKNRMRVVPTISITLTGATYSNGSAGAVSMATTDGCAVGFTVTALGGGAITFNATTSFIEADAEL